MKVKEPNIYSFFDECYVYYGDYCKEIDKLNKEKQRLKKYMQLERDIALKREDYEIADVYQKCLDKMKEFKQKGGEE